jgi:hypothetical protein
VLRKAAASALCSGRPIGRYTHGPGRKFWTLERPLNCSACGQTKAAHELRAYFLTNTPQRAPTRQQRLTIVPRSAPATRDTTRHGGGGAASARQKPAQTSRSVRTTPRGDWYNRHIHGALDVHTFIRNGSIKLCTTAVTSGSRSLTSNDGSRQLQLELSETPRYFVRTTTVAIHIIA